MNLKAASLVSHPHHVWFAILKRASKGAFVIHPPLTRVNSLVELGVQARGVETEAGPDPPDASEVLPFRAEPGPSDH
jgi:hypothetical protein